ncbi:hypothetical protein MJO51_12130, partial [Clostridioides difficile]|nr:hypothetical protein [Clostridioides difficile]
DTIYPPCIKAAREVIEFNYKIIEKIEVVKNILNIYTDESNYKIRLRALSLEDEKKLLNIIDEKMKKFKA